MFDENFDRRLGRELYIVIECLFCCWDFILVLLWYMWLVSLCLWILRVEVFK